MSKKFYLLVETDQLPISFGATGRFPQGKYAPSDEGEIQFGVAADKNAGKVLINFGKPIAWMGMDADQADSLGDLLKAKATEIRDK